MINSPELVRRPLRERDLLPIASNAQILRHFQERIEGIRRAVQSPVRLSPNYYRQSSFLLHISGEQEYFLIEDRHSAFGQQRVERGMAQDLLFKVMTAYGLDQHNSHPHRRYNYKNKKYEEDITKLRDGTTREVHIYPSQTIEGLVFERTRFFVTETQKTTAVWWNAVDEGPHLKVDIPSVFRRKPKPQISL